MNIFEFEKKYKNILANIEEWAYIRIKVGYFFKNRLEKNKTKSSLTQKIVLFVYSVSLFVKNMFYGLKYWFRKYDYLFFSDSSQRKKINNLYYHRFFDETAKYVKNILLIERPASNHYKNIPSKSNVVSENLLTFIMGLCVPFVFIILRNKRENPLIELLKVEKIDINYFKEYIKFHSRYYVYKLLLKIYKPKKVFLTCYYCYLPLVKACNDLNIEVIEYQHGVISPFLCILAILVM